MSIGKISYFLWAAVRYPGSDTTCPGCGDCGTDLVRRKWAVTALYRCSNCGLMFRVPKQSPEQSERFYQSGYQQGFTTNCPTAEQLRDLIRCSFATTEKEFSRYILVLQAAGVAPGLRVLDFGCSWGYGSWQLRRAGYEVLSYDISRPRSRYAEEMLGCTMVDPTKLEGTIDCFFSAHVLEHLDHPRELWKLAARALKPQGLMITFVPNGSLNRKEVHTNWGKVHPLLIDADGLSSMASAHGFQGLCYTSPYNLHNINTQSLSESLDGDELVMIARRAISFES